MKATYVDYLKYNLLLRTLPLIILVTLYFITLKDNFARIFDMFVVILESDDELPASMDWTPLGDLLLVFLMAILFGIVWTFLRSGLYFMPALAVQGQMKLPPIMHVGTRKFLWVYVLVMIGGASGGTVLNLLAQVAIWIPILGWIIYAVVSAYCMALVEIISYYYLSYNLLHGHSTLARPGDRLQEVLGTKANSNVYLLALALAGSSLVLLNILVVPIIQMKIAEMISRTRTDDSDAFALGGPTPMSANGSSMHWQK